MHFSPPLAQTTRISYKHGQPLLLLFSASLHRPDLASPFQQHLAKLQLWSDLPDQLSAPGTRADWLQRDFALVPSPPPGTPVESRGALLQFDLQITLYPWLLQSHQRISFTYRISHSSGDAEWLGEYGQNGVIELVNVGNKGLVDPSDPCWSLVDDAEDQCRWEWRSESEPFSSNLPHMDLYASWCISPEGIVRGPKAERDSQLVLLVPRAQPHPCVRIPYIALRPRDNGAALRTSTSASGGLHIASASAAPGRHVSVDFIWEHPNLAHYLTQLGQGLVETQHITEDPTTIATVVLPQRTSPSAFPLHALVLPPGPLARASDKATSRTRISSKHVLSVLDRPAGLLWGIELEAQQKSPAAVFSGPWEANVGKEFLEVQEGGSLFAVSPAYRHDRDEVHSCVFALQTPHSIPVEHHDLPTPPPSPPYISAPIMPTIHASLATLATEAAASSETQRTQEDDTDTDAVEEPRPQPKARGFFFGIFMFTFQLYWRSLRFLYHRFYLGHVVKKYLGSTGSTSESTSEDTTGSETSDNRGKDEEEEQEEETSTPIVPEPMPSLPAPVPTKITLNVPGGEVRLLMSNPSVDTTHQFEAADILAKTAVKLLFNTRRVEDVKATILDRGYVAIAADVGPSPGVLEVVCTF